MAHLKNMFKKHFGYSKYLILFEHISRDGGGRLRTLEAK